MSLEIALQQLKDSHEESFPLVTESTTLFHIEEQIEQMCPLSLKVAMITATAILRSNYYKACLMQMSYDILNNEYHIAAKPLHDLLARNDLFLIDQIRLIRYINERSCSLGKYDPWKVYINPLLLLEFKIQETEAEAIELLPEKGAGDDQITFLSHFDRNGEPSRRPLFNSLAYIKQMAAIDLPSSTPTHRVKKSKAATSASCSATIQMGIIPSNLSLFETHVTMLTILLLHESSHLINYALSVNFDRIKHTGRTQPNCIAGEMFQDIGHMMERFLFKFSITHGVDPQFPTLFGVKHIIGSFKEKSKQGYVLQPSPVFRSIIQNAWINKVCDPNEISAEMLIFEKTSEVLYKPSESFQFASARFEHETREGFSGQENSEEENEEEDCESSDEEENKGYTGPYIPHILYNSIQFSWFRN